jgi:hypothetical protein
MVVAITEIYDREREATLEKHSKDWITLQLTMSLCNSPTVKGKLDKVCLLLSSWLYDQLSSNTTAT